MSIPYTPPEEWEVVWMQGTSLISRMLVKARSKQSAIDKSRDIMYRRGYQPNYLQVYATKRKPLEVKSTQVDAQGDMWYDKL